MLDKKNFIENLKTLFYALIIALIIRSIIIQPFYIPSSSMEPNLLVGDRLFVTKYSYGYSKHSFPFSPSIFSGRILSTIQCSNGSSNLSEISIFFDIYSLTSENILCIILCTSFLSSCSLNLILIKYKTQIMHYTNYIFMLRYMWTYFDQY